MSFKQVRDNKKKNKGEIFGIFYFNKKENKKIISFILKEKKDKKKD